MSTHAPRKHATESRDPKTGEKIVVYMFSCTPCNIYGKAFRTKSQRDKLADEHK